LAACQPASDGASTPTAETPTSTPSPAEAPQTNQADIATLTAALQSRLDETCQADPLLCQAYEAYKNSRETDPVHSLALGLLEISTDSDAGSPSFTLTIDPINGEPVVYLNFDSTDGSAGALLRPAIGGYEGYLLISTSPYGEKARISHEGPCVANAYDEDGQSLGGVSAKTGQWVDAGELTQEDRKARIEFAGQMELLARQVSQGKMTLAEATAGMSMEQRLDFSGILVKLSHQKNKNLSAKFEGKPVQIQYQTDGVAAGEKVNFRESSQFAIPATINEEGKIVYRGPNDEIIVTEVGLDFFKTETELADNIYKQSTTKDWSERIQEEPSSETIRHAATFLPQGVKYWTMRNTQFTMFPALVYRSGYEAMLPPEDYWNENRWIIVQVVAPEFNDDGEGVAEYLGKIGI